MRCADYSYFVRNIYFPCSVHDVQTCYYCEWGILNITTHILIMNMRKQVHYFTIYIYIATCKFIWVFNVINYNTCPINFPHTVLCYNFFVERFVDFYFISMFIKNNFGLVPFSGSARLRFKYYQHPKNMLLFSNFTSKIC